MTRRHRGYPYPAHGRAIDYTHCNTIWLAKFRKFSVAMSDLATACADVLNPFLNSVVEWWDSLSPELKAAIAIAARAQQE